MKTRPAIPWLLVAAIVVTVKPAMAEAQGFSWLDEPSASKCESAKLLERYLDHLSERIGHPKQPDEALWTIDEGNRREFERQAARRFERAAGRAALDLAGEIASENFNCLGDTLECLKDWSSLTLDYGYDKKSKPGAYEGDWAPADGSAGGDDQSVQLDDGHSGLKFKLRLTPSLHHYYPGVRLELRQLEFDGIRLCDGGTFTIYGDGRMGLGLSLKFDWGYLSFGSSEAASSSSCSWSQLSSRASRSCWGLSGERVANAPLLTGEALSNRIFLWPRLRERIVEMRKNQSPGASDGDAEVGSPRSCCVPIVFAYPLCAPSCWGARP